MKQNIFASVIALATGAAADSALAQSSITMYGVVDTGVLYTNNANANGDSVVKIPSLTGTVPSRIGFKGTEDLGGGLQALFVLESGFAPDTGTMSQGNRLFGRAAYVGLKGSWGQLMLGRQINMTFLAPIRSDVIGPNIFSLGSIDAYLPNARSDNAIGYLGNFKDVTIGATYSLGRDSSAAGGPAATNCAGEVAGNAKACRQVTGLLAYDGRKFGISASYDVLYGNAGAAGGLSSSDNKDQRITANGYFMLNDVKIGAGTVDRRTCAAAALDTDSSLYYLGASVPVTPLLVLDAQISRLDVKRSRNDLTLAVARLTYYLSKRTAVYTSVGHMDNEGMSAVPVDAGGTVGAGKNQFGVMTGIRHLF